MKCLIKFILVLSAFSYSIAVSAQQTDGIRGLHKVKKKETVFGIARMYDISIDELRQANPEMNQPDYQLRKGDVVRIPYAGQTQASKAMKSDTQETVAPPSAPVQAPSGDVRNRPIRLGVMLPLHNINGDGRRMVEYYRGILLACDSLKRKGLSFDIHAWNAAEDADVSQLLIDPAAAKCDIIFGPLYSRQMQVLSDFVSAHGIRLVIPFSISAPQLTSNPNIFQVWQSPTTVSDATVARFMEQFRGYHPVFIDCNDSTSRKGTFTAALRRQLDSRGIAYSLTNLKSSEDAFAKAFDATRKNIVILNTGRSPELGVAFAKLNGLQTNQPSLNISMLGYTEWLMYTRTHLENFFKFNTYVPSTFHYNPLTAGTARLEQLYRSSFHSEMQTALPRFALAGFDHAYFFLMGLHKYGIQFNGAAGMFGYPPVQTPLAFERVGGGGFQNRSLLFVHYTPDHKIETLKFANK